MRAPQALPLLLCTLLLPACAIPGHWIVRAPNHGRSLAQVRERTTERGLALPDTTFAHAFRVERPDASLSVGIIDPGTEVPAPLPHRPLDPSDAQGGDGNDGRPLVPRFIAAAQTPPAPRGTVLIVHGFYNHGAQLRYLTWARVLAAAGYRVVLVDQRGHGDSTGDFVTYGVKESVDLSAVLDALDARGLRVGPLAVFGVSLGAASAAGLAQADPRVDALVLLSPYTSMRDVLPGYARAIGFTMFTDLAFERFIDSRRPHRRLRPGPGQRHRGGTPGGHPHPDLPR